MLLQEYSYSDMSNQLYAHFHSDEHSFVDKALDWIERTARNHEQRITEFLDPRQIYILTTLVNREPDVQLVLSGGYAAAERKRAIIAPDYAYIDADAVPLQVLTITSEDAKFPSLEHGDFLGAILGLGIKREKLGDIHVHADACDVIVASEMIDYIHTNLQQVHRVHVFTDRKPLDELSIAESQLEEMRLSVASMRLDGIVSDVIRLSRAKTVIPIKAGRCKVNWKVEENPSTPLSEGDVVSLQGFGRFKLLSVEGISKSGRIRVIIGKYV